MSLDTILKEIHDSAEAGIQAIEARTDSQVQAMIDEAQAEAETIRQENCRQALGPAWADRAHLLNRARLRSVQIIAEAHQAVMEQTLDRVRERLAQLRTETDYPQVLHSLTSEALETLGRVSQNGSDLSLRADERDRDSLEQILKELDHNPAVTYDLEQWGGVIAVSADGRLVVDNTLEARLDRAWPYLTRVLAATFTGEQS